MLSILIPTFNYNVYPLVLELKKQTEICGISYEILVQDDASNSVLNAENKKINQLTNCIFLQNETNLGRSKNRNVLAKKANYEWLLFLDADIFPKSPHFISNYIAEFSGSQKVVYGGIRYTEQKPSIKHMLRWIYGKNREALCLTERNKNVYLSFLTLNFLIRKQVFETILFNEKIPNLRHEDTLFSYELKKNKIQLKHIENPALHYGLDPFEIALQKEHESILALKLMVENNLLPKDYVEISRWYFVLKNYKLRLLVSWFFKIIKPILIKNISSSNPSLFLFDVYRMGYLCSL